MLEKECVSQRIEQFRKRMQKEEINLAIITKPVDIYHFSLFNPVVQSMMSFMLIPLEGEPCLLVHALRGGHAKMDSPIKKIRMYAKWGDAVSVAMDPFEALKIVVEEYGIKNLHVGSELGFLSMSNYLKMKDALGVEKIADITDAISFEKLIKDELAIERLKKAADLSNIGMNSLVYSLKNGATEIEACNEATKCVLDAWNQKYPEFEMCGFGTSEEQITMSLCITCSSGSRISFGADAPRKHVPENGELTLPISIATIGGYSVENERSMYAGELDDYKMSIFETVIEAREEVFKQIIPGNTFAQLYDAAAQVFEKRGFGQFLPGRIGHGMGLSLHEWPSVAKGSDEKLQPGMVFTVEPGLMSATFGGVRPSDTVLVTEDGYINLTNTENGIMKI